MKIAFIIYDGITALDFIGAFDPITRLDTMNFMDLSWDICGQTPTATATGNVTFNTDKLTPDLEQYDMIFIPGGYRARELQSDDEFLTWLKTAESCQYKSSVCTGSLLLGAAGFLEGLSATTHPNATDLLGEYCTVSTERIVHDDGVITARGVSSSIDFGLYLVEFLTDTETRETIQTQMDYPYEHGIQTPGT
jgi:cyclohexyl-isocyanide hydratase